MIKSKVLLVSIRSSYNATRKKIKKGIASDDYRKTLRDMTVQYWTVSRIAPQIGIICGVKGNVIYSAFEVNKSHSFDVKYRVKSNKVAFNCDKVREDLIGIRLPNAIAFNGGYMLRSIDIEQFYELISSQYESGEVFDNRNKVFNELETDGIPLDNEYGKRMDYPKVIDFDRREFGNERDQNVRRKALERAGFKCELIDCDKCDFCESLSPEQRSRIDVHHIDELHDDPINNDNIENLIALCNCFHRRYHYHMTEDERSMTKKRFQDIRAKKEMIYSGKSLS